MTDTDKKESPPKQVILICGSRYGMEGAAEVIRNILLKYDLAFTTVLHGGAPGIDSIAGKVAEMMKFPVKVEYADWNLGKKGGPLRNSRMIAMLSKNDHVYALPCKKSTGTWDTVDKAQRAGIPITVIDKWLK